MSWRADLYNFYAKAFGQEQVDDDQMPDIGMCEQPARGFVLGRRDANGMKRPSFGAHVLLGWQYQLAVLKQALQKPHVSAILHYGLQGYASPSAAATKFGAPKCLC